MLKIGMIGPDFLLQRNQEIFQRQQIKTIFITDAPQLHQIDGLLITGWNYGQYLQPLKRLRNVILARQEQLALLGIAAGAAAFGKNGVLPVMDCHITQQSAQQLTTAVLDIPSFAPSRFTAAFLPEVRFSHLAPNLGVLCRDSRRGPVVVRQGNVLACSYAAELTPRLCLYDYWLEMVAALKNSKDF